MAIQAVTAPLRIFRSNDLNSYAVSAKELRRSLFPFAQNDDFHPWLNSHIEHYGFEEGFDFEREVDDVALTLSAAKELARIERTKQGREIRYHLIGFEYELLRTNYQESMEKIVHQLNQFSDSVKVGHEVVVMLTCDLVNLVQAIRQYQYLSHFYATPDNDINPIWVNRLIEKIKRTTGKTLIDEDVY
ncbi:hypothetical protein CBF23_013490 [Marinomonas agarivorans]|nr:hypothetical protein CBF23_013490 [Marinomonas agarivorans]